MSDMDAVQMKVNDILVSPNASERIRGLFTDINMLQRDLAIANQFIENERKVSRAKLEEVVAERNQSVSALQKEVGPLRVANKDQQKEIFWLRSQYEDLVDKILNRGGNQ